MMVIILQDGETIPVDDATDEQIASAVAFVKKH